MTLFQLADSAIGAKGIALPLCDADGARWLAHVLPLTSGARQGSGVAYSAVAAVFVHKAALDLVSPWESMARQYQLTPGELRVLHALAQVEGVGAAAAALGISEATVKTHLQNLFEKTATARQTELVKLVAAHASPFAN